MIINFCRFVRCTGKLSLVTWAQWQSKMGESTFLPFLSFCTFQTYILFANKIVENGPNFGSLSLLFPQRAFTSLIVLNLRRLHTPHPSLRKQKFFFTVIRTFSFVRYVPGMFLTFLPYFWRFCLCHNGR